jgi:hypothetical protein
MTTNVKRNKLLKFVAGEARSRQFAITGEYNYIFIAQVFKKIFCFLRFSFQCISNNFRSVTPQGIRSVRHLEQRESAHI